MEATDSPRFTWKLAIESEYQYVHVINVSYVCSHLFPTR